LTDVPRDDHDDPVPLGLVLDLDEAFRVLEALEDALLELERAGRRPWTARRARHGDPGRPP